MDECGKPESTARAKMIAFRYARDSLIKISTDGKQYFLDPEKVNLLEALVDEVIYFSNFDYRCEQLKEWAELYYSQSDETEDLMKHYCDLKALNEKQQIRLYREKQELRKDFAKTITGISEKVMALVNNCDERLQQFEQRDFIVKELPFFRACENLLSDKAWADTNKRIAKDGT